MEQFTATSYESAMKLAKTKFKNGFEVINTREIDLSNSGLSDETELINRVVSVKKAKKLQLQLKNQTKSIDSIGINYRRKSVK